MPKDPRTRRFWTGLVLLCLAIAGLGFCLSEWASSPVRAQEGSGSSSARARDRSGRNSGGGTPAFLRGFDPRERSVEEVDGQTTAFADLAGGNRAALTVDPELEAHLASTLARYEVPFGSVVAIEPATGRVLAYVSHSSELAGGDRVPDLALDPTPPTASVFKIITAAALVDAGVGADEEVCYHGGAGSIRLSHLEDSPRDRRCATLSDAVGSSINVIFGKLSTRHLDAPTLERYASAFGFGHALPFDVATLPSPAEVPHHERERLEFARTSAGFWHMHMSPLHGAMIASVFANDGRMMRPTLIEAVLRADGSSVREFEASVFRNVIPRRTARTVGAMMERTVSHGTARSAFFDPQGNAFLPNISVAGKTGTLSGSEPYRGYTWWVGFAPADNPTIAVASLVVNTPRWRIKAPYLAREALRYYLLEGRGRNGASAAD